MEEWEDGRFVRFQKRTHRWCVSAGEPVTKTATLLSAAGATVPEVILKITLT